MLIMFPQRTICTKGSAHSIWKPAPSWFLFFILIFFDILCIYISPPLPSPCFYDDPTPTHPLPPQHPGIPLFWGNEPSQDQGLFILLMLDKAILCYMLQLESWVPLCVYSLVDSLVPESSGGVWLVDIVVLHMLVLIGK